MMQFCQRPVFATSCIVLPVPAERLNSTRSEVHLSYLKHAYHYLLGCYFYCDDTRHLCIQYSSTFYQALEKLKGIDRKQVLLLRTFMIVCWPLYPLAKLMKNHADSLTSTGANRCIFYFIPQLFPFSYSQARTCTLGEEQDFS